MFKKNYIMGASIVLAALVLGIFMVCTVKTLKSYDDTVKVRGLCEKEVPADRVVWRISYGEKANDLADLRNTIRKNNDIIVKQLRDAGFSEVEIKVGNASYEDRYSWASNPNQIPFRYNANQTVTVFTKNLDLVRKLQQTLETDLVNQNILANTWADYQYLGLNDIKPEMIRIDFEVEDLDENTPQVKKIRVVTTVEYYLK